MLNWLKNLWSKIKEITSNAKKSIVDWWYKNRRKIGIIIGVLLYTLCVFFLGYCSKENDNSTAKADGIVVPVGGETIDVVYSDIELPYIKGRVNNGVYFTNMSFTGSFSLLYKINSNEDIITHITLNDTVIYYERTWYPAYIPMVYLNSFTNSYEYYAFYIEVSDYNLPTADIYGSALDMIYKSFNISYIVNNMYDVVITYEWVDTNDLYYIDFRLSMEGLEISNVYEQKFDYYVYDLSSSYVGAYTAGFSMGYAEGAQVGYQDGYAQGAQVGYQNAINDGQSAGFFGSIAKMVNDLVSIELFPGVPLSYVILIAFGFVALRIILNLFAA